MKFLKLPSLLAIIFVLSTCSQENQEVLKLESNEIEVLYLSESSELKAVIGKLDQEWPKEGRVNSLLDNVDFSKAVNRFDMNLGVSYYTFSMTDENYRSMRIFVLRENLREEILGHVFEYEADSSWLSGIDTFTDWTEYDGWFRILELDGSLLSENKIQNGASVKNEDPSSNGGGRVEGGINATAVVCDTYTRHWCVGDSSNPCSGGYYNETWTECAFESYQEFWQDGEGGGVQDTFGTETIVFDPDDSRPDPPSPEEQWEQNKICTTGSFDSNTCIKNAWNRLISGDIAFNLLKKLVNENPEAEVCLDVKPKVIVNGKEVNGSTDGRTSPIAVTLSAERAGNRSDIEVARTILHEMIHAEMHRKIQSIGGIVNLSEDNFPGLFDYYSRHLPIFKRDGTWHFPTGAPQHNLMAEFYLDKMAYALMQFDGVDPNDDILFDAYEALAWRGLEETELYRSFPDYEKLAIKDLRDLLLQEREKCK